MKISDLLKRRTRVHRMRQMTMSAAHRGASRSAAGNGSDTVLIEVVEIKSLSAARDVIRSLFVWLWNVSYSMQRVCLVNGIDPREIDRFVASEPALQIVADVANASMDFGSGRSHRSPRNATLENVRLDIPPSQIGSISCARDSADVGCDITLPRRAEVHAQVEFGNGDPPIDAFVLIDQAIEAWEKRGFSVAGLG